MMPNRARTTCVLLCTALATFTGSAVAGPAFTPDGKGGYAFDAGVLRGTLRAEGKSRGLSPLTLVSTGARLDRYHGLLSYYRVFTRNKRYGTAAWDWPSQARQLDDGVVEVTWPRAEDRPFTITGTYRTVGQWAIDLVTTVHAHEDLDDFEIFVASYCAADFPLPYVFVKPTTKTSGKRGFLLAREAYGPWQMFPRDKDVVGLIRDGRWAKEPHPVDWTIMPRLAGPLCVRRAAAGGLTLVLMAPPNDCFAISTPYEGEGHYSLYLSLFGRDIKSGQTATARIRLVILTDSSDEDIVAHYRQYVKELAREK
ncbi:MAG: hypothetical protein ACYTAS_04570 [Planctomycetota bacterium]|jgi:hypothetical protein